ncbi:DNA-binding protein [Polaribacter reichenbachii]|uniref:Helix-turn-helix domain-containing protein n=1 Tax=Polaribacter reichenbachii TaxID=996801 RepID=A0A1B8U4A7_9FLAO|nr:helix-turn-helix domain-containing protein [Polaribacter reichenbachii]APZ47434.1 DNA-binding protein [Polaribacter reichenbachii]AUC18072.1 DNA-binding protein [Polaribacter reichenbachii]OBY66683.1 hypothetical protein LPB301_05640 [Polaribacter reichenbachii]
MSKNKDGDNKPNYGYTIEDINDEIWLTFEDVLMYFKISESTLKRWIKKDMIPSCKLGKMRLYPKKLINRVLIKTTFNTFNKFKK